MILFVNYNNSFYYRKELDDMFLDRCRTFTHRLKWVPSMNDREVDQFDTYMAKPTYMICVDEDKNYLGSARFLDTTGKNMLKDVFSYLMPDGGIPNDPHTLELSRVTIVNKGQNRVRGFLSPVLGELLMGMYVYANNIGYKNCLAVLDDRMYRIMKLSGMDVKLLAPPYLHHDEDGDHYAYVGLIATNKENYERGCKIYNINSLDSNIKVFWK